MKCLITMCKNVEYKYRIAGGGVHDLQMDGGLPPGFQKGTFF